MAELVIGIAGMALAWKGILDFGKIISRLADDDDRERRYLALNLECSQQRLKDWGEHWEFGRDNGRFSSLETSRKELILRVIFQLRDSREIAIKRLRKRYGLFLKEEEEAKATQSEDRLSKLVDNFLAIARKSKKKSQWLTGDDTFLLKLVDETNHLHEHLNQLTSMSVKVLAAKLDTFRAAKSLESSLATIADQVKQYAQVHIKHVCQPDEPTVQSTAKEIDLQTLVGYATDSVILSSQRETVSKYIDNSLYHSGDARIPETIATWWNDLHKPILVLELPDDAEDDTATLACVLLYYMADCHKLIYIFEPHSSKKPAQQLLEMLQTFITSLVSLRGNKPLATLSEHVGIKLTQNAAADCTTMLQLMEVLFALLRDNVQSNHKRILLIVSGLELSGLYDENGTSRIVEDFVTGLHGSCDTDSGDSETVLKALVTHKGHATSLYSKVGPTDVAALTDHASIVTSLREKLALSLDIM